jgi:hypothetical protein
MSDKAKVLKKYPKAFCVFDRGYGVWRCKPADAPMNHIGTGKTAALAWKGAAAKLIR